MSKLRNIPTRLSHARLVGLTLSAAAVGAVTACSVDPVSAPVATAAAHAIGTTSGSTLISSTALLRTTPLLSPVSASIRLYRQGGSLSLPGTGLMVTIPRTAIGDTAVTITVTALPGSAVAYDFQPHGTQFTDKLQLKQALSGTTWAGNTGNAPLEGGYFANSDQVDTATGAAMLDERLPASVSGNSVIFGVSHFSGYMVAWGVANN